jgi:hypothetical protein
VLTVDCGDADIALDHTMARLHLRKRPSCAVVVESATAG